MQVSIDCRQLTIVQERSSSPPESVIERLSIGTAVVSFPRTTGSSHLYPRRHSR